MQLNKARNNQKANFLTTYIPKIPAYIRDLQTEKSINRILERFEERENLENLDGSNLSVDMPDDFYQSKAKYEQAGIVFCPHVNSTGITSGKLALLNVAVIVISSPESTLAGV